MSRAVVSSAHRGIYPSPPSSVLPPPSPARAVIFLPSPAASVSLWPDVPRHVPLGAMMDNARAPAAKANASSEESGSGPQGPTPLVRHGHELPFVAPSSYLRPKPNSHTMSEPKAAGPLDRDQMQGLVSIFQRHSPLFAGSFATLVALQVSSPRVGADEAMRGTGFIPCPPEPNLDS